MEAPIDSGSFRLSELKIGSLCRIGIAVSTAFWMPVSILLGVAGFLGMVPMARMAGVPDGISGFVAGFLEGIACSIVNDLIVVAGAAIVASCSLFGLGPNVTLHLNGR